MIYELNDPKLLGDESAAVWADQLERRSKTSD
jgi:hypothetical protein